jgi:predicted CoA-binding protein
MENQHKKTLVVGGSAKSHRYSNKAIRLLREYGHPVVSVGLRKAEVEDVSIETGQPDFKDIDTVTMYVGPQRQEPLYHYLLNLNPRRIIFNPGTENDEFQEMATEKGIEVVTHCTLIMLNHGLF